MEPLDRRGRWRNVAHDRRVDVGSYAGERREEFIRRNANEIDEPRARDIERRGYELQRVDHARSVARRAMQRTARAPDVRHDGEPDATSRPALTKEDRDARSKLAKRRPTIVS